MRVLHIRYLEDLIHLFTQHRHEPFIDSNVKQDPHHHSQLKFSLQSIFVRLWGEWGKEGGMEGEGGGRLFLLSLVWFLFDNSSVWTVKPVKRWWLVKCCGNLLSDSLLEFLHVFTHCFADLNSICIFAFTLTFSFICEFRSCELHRFLT